MDYHEEQRKKNETQRQLTAGRKDDDGWERYPDIVHTDGRSFEVSIARGSKVIAREIKRRFLPEYTRILERIRKCIQESDEFEAGKQRTFERICEACRLAPRPKHTREMQTSWYNGESSYGDMCVNSENSVEVKIRSLSADAAIAVINAARGRGC